MTMLGKDLKNARTTSFQTVHNNNLSILCYIMYPASRGKAQ